MGLNTLTRLVTLAALFAFAVFLGGKAMPASATPTALTLDGAPTSVTRAVPLSVLVAATYTDEGAAPQDFVLNSSVAAVGYFSGFSVAGADAEARVITPTMTAAQPTILTVTDDADTTVDTVTVTAFFLCVSAGTTTITATQNGVPGAGGAAPLTITCTGGTTTIQFSTTSPVLGVAFTVTATCGAAGQTLTSSTTPGNGAFSVPTGPASLTNATTVTCTGAGAISAPYICTVAGVVTFTFNALPNTVTCGGTTGGLTVSPASGMSGAVTGTCPAAGSLLTQTGPATFTGLPVNGTITAAGSITCTAAGTIVAAFVCNITGTVSFALGAMSGSFVCTTTGIGYNPCLTTPYAYNCATNYNQNCITYAYQPAYGCTNTQYQQYPQAVAVTPSSLTISAASPSVVCGQTQQVRVQVVGSNGGTVPDGTAVALAASVGTLSPASSTTSGGALTATYTAPANVPATNVTLRATAGAATNTTSVAITCTQTTMAPSTTTAPPPVAVSIPATLPVITPPSTGDAGLLALLRDDACVD